MCGCGSGSLVEMDAVVSIGARSRQRRYERREQRASNGPYKRPLFGAVCNADFRDRAYS
jgi:hypothetical protein